MYGLPTKTDMVLGCQAYIVAREIFDDPILEKVNKKIDHMADQVSQLKTKGNCQDSQLTNIHVKVEELELKCFPEKPDNFT